MHPIYGVFIGVVARVLLLKYGAKEILHILNSRNHIICK